jgi:hypothetical protein
VKCIHCGAKTKYSDRRATRRCARCRHEFAFEPRESDSVSDLAFKYALQAVSDDGRLSWTDRNLYYEVARRVRRRRWRDRLVRRPFPCLVPTDFEGMVRRWSLVHGAPPGKLADRAFAERSAEGSTAPDVADYAFERVVICDSEDAVDVLLANRFHADNRCPVFSFDGYPAQAYETLLPRLQDNPPEMAIVVHDADPAGCSLATRVGEDPRWFGRAGSVSIVDAGLRPADARRFRGVYLQGSPLDVGDGGITAEERKWLSNYRLELAAVRPRTLLTVLAGILRGEIVPTDRDKVGTRRLRRIWDGDGVWIGDGDDDAG